MSVLLAALLSAAIAHAGRGVEMGNAVPGFSAKSIDGEEISLAAAARSHKAVVVLFLSTACPFAEFFAGHVRDLDATYRPRGVLFIGVNSNRFETIGEMREDAREHGHAFALIRDEDARIANLLGAGRTPEAFLLDGEGRLRYHGWVKSKQRSPDLERAIEAVLAGRKVRRAETKPFGCAIDRARP